MKDINEGEIHRYLQGSLSPEAHKAFEEEMKTNPELAQAVQLERIADDLDFLLLEEQMLKKTRQWDAERKHKRRRYIILIALLIAAILGSGAYYYFFRNAVPATSPIATPPVKITPAADSLSKPPDIPIASTNSKTANPALAWEKDAKTKLPRLENLHGVVIRQMGETSKDAFAEGINAIKKGSYAKAIAYFQQKEQSGELDDDGRGLLIYGYACFLNRNYSRAEKCFRKALLTPQLYKNETEWMLCLAIYAQKGPIDHKTLQALAIDPEHPYWQQIQQLMQTDTSRRLKERQITPGETGPAEPRE